ncbi:LysM peptidoglycan-binding domain-containing protein [Propionivibrio soli]|uniref:LysM peptidoglycan-binding domain-containing protein n=1 Tax=Propionivibrio soli TaxID=2976531 RepID=UPI0021E99BFF|nr:LysM peptidoglycan-binding domain-containing protein [Propionivibrio soli]
MTPRRTISFSMPLARLIRCAAVVALLGLAGCASVPQNSGPVDQPDDSSLRSLRIADSAAASEKGSPIENTVAGLRRSQRQLSQSASGARLPTVELPPPLLAKPVDLTRESEDLFQRIRNGFSMPDINTDLVLYHQQWYLNRPDYLRRVIERSSRYLHFIVEELEKRGMPTELALLPMVESAYNPMAYSRAKASGLWQFIPATGKRYNLDQNWWRDDRRDIVASTAAALDYLQSIYEMHGDWHLALASYNWGEGAVARAVNKNQAAGLPTDYLSLTLPNETKNYVPKLQALKNIIGNPALVAELDLLRIPNRPYFSTVTPTSNIDVKIAAKLAEMPVDEFLALNPAHKGPVIMADTPLIIPTDKLDTFVSNLEEHEDSNKPLSAWKSYTLRPGDKLEKVAPRFGMTVANLKAVNGIKGRINVGPGVTLLVANRDGAPAGDLTALPNTPRLPDADPEPATRAYTVHKGETLAAIAKRFDMSVAELKRLNHLRADKVAAGSRLVVAEAKEKPTAQAASAQPRKAQAAKTPVETKRASASTQKAKPSKVTRYTIRRGDTLTSIAKQFNVDTDDLLRWNRISPKSLIPGQTLTIYLAQNP